MKKNRYKKLGFATIDIEREKRCGFPEVIFCQGKTPEDTARIAKEILRHHKYLLATRADEKTYRAIKRIARDALYHKRALVITIDRRRRAECGAKRGLVVVITAGTSDIPVAEEARITAEMMGNNVKTLYDVGVAGIHRLLDHSQLIRDANVIIVVAGMEGALASVVGGLVDKPVIGVPTSVGYGAHFQGLAPLLTMLNSCAAGVAVVNIDNGFGAGYMASLINPVRGAKI
ncbi:MAG: nickel pincer cofactor biosynthesis protein LarB [Planctomycetota bacterium]